MWALFGILCCSSFGRGKSTGSHFLLLWLVRVGGFNIDGVKAVIFQTENETLLDHGSEKNKNLTE